MLFSNKNRKEIKLNEVTELLNELRLPTSMIFTPTNLEAEKRKFFNSDTYNPYFEYRIPENRNKKILKELSSIVKIVDVDPRISDFYLELIEAKINMDDLINAVGDNLHFTKISKNRFKKPSPILFRNACRILRNNVKGYNLQKELKEKERKDEPKYEYDGVKHAFELVLNSYGLYDWTINESMNIHASGMKVAVKRKEILMDKNIKRSLQDLKKSIVHEMVHIMRSYNGEKTGFDALSKPNLANYLDVEEGLATYTEEVMGVMRYKDLKKGAAKIWALHVGEQLSFRELYNAALSFNKKKEAFDLVYRVKRGLGDTSMPGLYCKDIAYFRGFKKVRKKCNDDKNLYRKLFAGKISFEQVKWVDEGLIPKPEIVPSEKKYKEVFDKLK